MCQRINRSSQSQLLVIFNYLSYMEPNQLRQNDIEDTSKETKSAKRTGWTASPFIIGCSFALNMASGGWFGNLIVYLITKYNVKSIDATQVNNVVLGCFSFFPIIAAIISDSFYGPFPVIVFFSFISLLGVTLMTITASLHSLRPPPCTNMCQSPSTFQYGVLYMTLGIASIGFGGTRFTIPAMGGDQFDDPNHTEIFFNWLFFFFYVASVISSTVLIYIQDNVSWTLGFGICVATNTVALVLFLSGNRFYRHFKPKGSPFTSIARVIIAAIRKRNVSSRNKQYNYDVVNGSTTPSDSFRFLNRGALKTESDGPTKPRSWSLSSVQEVEDLKTLIRILPLCSSAILLSTLVSMFGNFTILQALAMDRHLGSSSFLIPAASFLCFNTLASCISLFIIDRFIFPMWHNLTSRSLTPLHRIGIGHVLNIVALMASAVLELQRLGVTKSNHQIGQTFSALWLVVPLTILGASEAFHFPGQISLYYQEFPTALRSTSTAMMSLLVAVGYYVSTGITSLIRKKSGWLKDDINDGRLDLVYWMLAAIGSMNFAYFLICAYIFQHKRTTGPR